MIKRFWFGVSAVFSFASWAFPFPEESHRAVWDQGCADWPVKIVDAASPSLIDKNPQIAIEKSGGFLRVFASMRITPERGESHESFAKSVHSLFFDAHKYPSWVLPGINEKPTGGTYFVTRDGLSVSDRDPGMHFFLTGPFTFSVLWFKRAGIASLEVRHDSKLSPLECPLFINWPVASHSGSKQFEKVVFRMTPREDLIRLMMAEVWMLPSEKEITLRMRLSAQPSPIVYQLMPENLLRSEVEMRGRRMFQNFLEVRKNESFAKAPNAVSAPSSKPASRPMRVK